LKALGTLSVLAVTLCSAWASGSDPQVGATETGQAAADALKTYTSADGAFLPADLIGKPFAGSDLATILSYPTETFAVLTLTGSQIRKAFERSALLYPQPNAGFLQVSGFEISFSKRAVPNSRVTAVTINGSKLEDARKYEIAMPTSLQKGQLGYSDLWESAKVYRTFGKVTIQDVLAGKHSSSSSLRWLQQP
jgi:2',3'-cyclic-nucleotide 2'-phosphodiesterase (5'-nucleotidase family)